MLSSLFLILLPLCHYLPPCLNFHILSMRITGRFFDPKFELVGAIEKHHEERYRKLLKNIEDAVVFSREGDVIWQCSNCGHIVIGKKAPEVCPTCDHPQSYFQIKAENF